jgi:hypothetical protein
MEKTFFAVIQKWYGGYFSMVFNTMEELQDFLDSSKGSFATTLDYTSKNEYLEDLYEVEDDPMYHR